MRRLMCHHQFIHSFINVELSWMRHRKIRGKKSMYSLKTSLFNRTSARLIPGTDKISALPFAKTYICIETNCHMLVQSYFPSPPLTPHPTEHICSYNKINWWHPGPNGCHIRKRHFQTHFHEWKVSYSIKISLEFVTKGPIDNEVALVQVMALRRTGD